VNKKKSGYELAKPTVAAPTPWSYWVVQGRLLAGAYPGSPDPAEHRNKLQALLDVGVRTFINLMEENETNYQGRPFAPYDRLVEELCPEACCCRFAVADLSIPSVEQMKSILEAFDQSLDADRPIYVHCWGGVGRTGTVVGCWLLRHGLTTHDTVLRGLQQLRQQDQERGYRESPETPEQRRFVQAWQEEGDGES